MFLHLSWSLVAKDHGGIRNTCRSHLRQRCLISEIILAASLCIEFLVQYFIGPPQISLIFYYVKHKVIHKWLIHDPFPVPLCLGRVQAFLEWWSLGQIQGILSRPKLTSCLYQTHTHGAKPLKLLTEQRRNNNWPRASQLCTVEQ